MRWLGNKTPEVVASWIGRADNSLFVAVEANRILAVGSVTDAGEINVNYVSPDARFRGVEKAVPCSKQGLSKRGQRSEGNTRCI